MSRWSTDTDDWSRPGADAIVRRAMAGARPGAVILLHDSGPDMSQTVEALPRIIEGMRERGLRFAPELRGMNRREGAIRRSARVGTRADAACARDD